MLDVSKADGVVDLSLRPDLLPPPRKPGRPSKPTTELKADKWKVRLCQRPSPPLAAQSTGGGAPEG